MYRDSKTTMYSQLENGDTFTNYDGELMTVSNITRTKSGRIRFNYSTSKQKARPYSNGALADGLITK